MWMRVSSLFATDLLPAGSRRYIFSTPFRSHYGVSRQKLAKLVHLVRTKFTNRSSFVSWPGRPCHEAIVARASRPFGVQALACTAQCSLKAGVAQIGRGLRGCTRIFLDQWVQFRF